MNYSSLCIVLKGDIQEMKWEVLSTTFCHYMSKLFLASCSASWAFQPTSVIQGGGHGCYEQSFWWNPICFYFLFFVFLNLCLFCWSFLMCNLFLTYIYTHNGMMIKVWGFQTLGIWPKSLELSGSVKFWRESLSSDIWVPTLRIKPVLFRQEIHWHRM